MKDDFKALYQSLLDATKALIAANAGLVATNQQLVAIGEALTKATRATSAARDEHEDLRETVARLEALVNELLRRQQG